jgi:beta-phosphoglucomutase-like phosphatase (HAD superfamily)
MAPVYRLRCGPAGRDPSVDVFRDGATGYRAWDMVPTIMTTTRDGVTAAGLSGSVAVAALICHAITLVPDAATPVVPVESLAALGRARALAVRVAVVHDGWPASSRRLRRALGPVDLVDVPQPCERTAGRRDEVRPQFVRRICDRLGVDVTDCVVVDARRPLLAAATWAGARTVMVPSDATPPFDVRGQPHVAPHLDAALDAALSLWRIP